MKGREGRQTEPPGDYGTGENNYIDVDDNLGDPLYSEVFKLNVIIEHSVHLS